MPASISQRATAAIDEPDKPGPSSTIAKRAALRPIAATSAAMRRSKGGPIGRTVSGAGAPAATATTQARLAPMLRSPITCQRPRGQRRAASR